MTPWTVALQGLLPMKFSRQEYWSVLPFPPPGNLPDRGIKPKSVVSPALGGGFFTTARHGKTPVILLSMNLVSGKYRRYSKIFAMIWAIESNRCTLYNLVNVTSEVIKAQSLPSLLHLLTYQSKHGHASGPLHRLSFSLTISPHVFTWLSIRVLWGFWWGCLFFLTILFNLILF